MIRREDHFLIAGLGLEFATVMCMGCFGGYFLDKKYHSSPLFTLLLSAAAFAFAIYIVVRTAKQALKDEGSKK